MTRLIPETLPCTPHEGSFPLGNATSATSATEREDDQALLSSFDVSARQTARVPRRLTAIPLGFVHRSGPAVELGDAANHGRIRAKIGGLLPWMLLRPTQEAA
jgi:hypothetical protein